MPDSGPFIDQRALQVLYDVVRDPKSSLLRMDRPRAFSADLGQGRAELAMPVAGLSAAEKELLGVYREETAYLLRLAYFERSYRPRPERDRGLIIPLERDREAELGDEEIARRVRDLGKWARGDGEPTVEAAIDALSRPQVSMMELACLSARFAPSVSATSYIVDEHLSVEESASALVVCERGLREAMSATLRTHLVTRLSMSCSMMGDFHEAMTRQREDVLVSSPNMQSALNWALYAMRCGEPDAASESLQFLDSNWDSGNSRFSQWRVFNTHRIQCEPSTLNHATLLLARSLHRTVGEVGAEVLDFVIRAATHRDS